MEFVHIGKIINHERMRQGYTLQDICQGLCAPATLTRLENDAQAPSQDCVIAILQRLGLPDDIYHARLTQKESVILQAKKRIESERFFFEVSSGEEMERHRITTLQAIRRLEKHLSPYDRLNQQFLVLQEMTVGHETGSYSLSQQEEMTLSALRLTIPDFDYDKLPQYLLTRTEAGLLIHMMNVYGDRSQFREEAFLGSLILKNFEKHCPQHDSLLSVQYNYARALTLDNRFEEALEVIAKAKEQSIEEEHYVLLPSLFHLEAECLYLIGKTEASKESSVTAHYLYQLMDQTRDLAHLDEDILNRFGLEF